jgi:hypothetical protein
MKETLKRFLDKKEFEDGVRSFQDKLHFLLDLGSN